MFEEEGKSCKNGKVVVAKECEACGTLRAVDVCNCPNCGLREC
jgi:hypothetical protein